jgi:hypothetical protein
MRRYYSTGRSRGEYISTISLMKAGMGCFQNTGSWIRNSVGGVVLHLYVWA